MRDVRRGSLQDAAALQLLRDRTAEERTMMLVIEGYDEVPPDKRREWELYLHVHRIDHHKVNE